MEEAVRRLAGAIRLIDGLTPIRIDGAERASIPTVRVVYPDAPGREIWLDQWRVSGPVEGLKEDRRRLERDLDLLPGDTLVTKDAERWTIRWLDGNGFRLSLSGQVGADSLKALARRVR
jgi:hypothetical protein